jgi:acyl-CoA reductase-like NAD-dependent aldehyde dehydrogenase
MAAVGLAGMPHCAFKQSGAGKDTSVYSVLEYTEIKHAMIKLGG